LWLQELSSGLMHFWGTILLPLFVFSLASTVLSGGALLGSLLHLGQPKRAWRALMNWRTSPLSREIWMAGGFFGLAMLSVGVGLVGVETLRPGLVMAWTAAVALFGLAAVASMAGVYRLRTVPAWSQQRPTLVFLQTTLALGGLGTAALLALVNWLTFTWPGWVGPAWQAAAMAGIFGVAAILAWEALRRGEQDSFAGLHHLPSARKAQARIQPRIIRLHGVALLATVLGITVSSRAMPAWATIALGLAWLLALFGELQRRAAFYYYLCTLTELE
jgi:DMSO reductase anchor subunit